MTLDADPVRLAQVFANPLNNAAKYSDKGGRIWLKAEQAGEEALVSVRDEGAGIEADMLPRVFDLFAQANGVSRHERGGLGVGLALARGLVQLQAAASLATATGLAWEANLRCVCRRMRPLSPERNARRAPPPRRSDAVVFWSSTMIGDVGDSLGILLKCLGVDARVVYGGPAPIVAITGFKPRSGLCRRRNARHGRL